MPAALSDVIGLGKKTQQHLIANGIESVEQLIANGESILLSTPRMTPNRARDIMQRAHEMVGTTDTGVAKDLTRFKITYIQGENGNTLEMDDVGMAYYEKILNELHEVISEDDLTTFDDEAFNEGKRLIQQAILKCKDESGYANISDVDNKLGELLERDTEPAQIKEKIKPSEQDIETDFPGWGFIKFIIVAICIWFAAYPVFWLLNTTEVTPLVSSWWYMGLFIVGIKLASYAYDDQEGKVVSLGILFIMSIVYIGEEMPGESPDNAITYDAPIKILVEGKADIYSGPGDNYKSVGQEGAGNSVLAVGKVKGKDWLEVTMKDGSSGYIRIDLPQRKMPLAQLSEKIITDPAISSLKFVLTNGSNYKRKAVLIRVHYNVDRNSIGNLPTKDEYFENSYEGGDLEPGDSLVLTITDKRFFRKGFHSFYILPDEYYSDFSPREIRERRFFLQGLILKIYKNEKLWKSYASTSTIDDVIVNRKGEGHDDSHWWDKLIDL